MCGARAVVVELGVLSEIALNFPASQVTKAASNCMLSMRTSSSQSCPLREESCARHAEAGVRAKVAARSEMVVCMAAGARPVCANGRLFSGQ